jgi:hypothetical protein
MAYFPVVPTTFNMHGFMFRVVAIVHCHIVRAWFEMGSTFLHCFLDFYFARGLVVWSASQAISAIGK